MNKFLIGSLALVLFFASFGAPVVEAGTRVFVTGLSQESGQSIAVRGHYVIDGTNAYSATIPFSAAGLNTQEQIHDAAIQAIITDVPSQDFPALEQIVWADVPQIQSDWTQASSTATDFIKNKPSNVSTTTSGFMSAADKTKLDGLVSVQRTTVTTDASGNYTWTYPTAYPSGQSPKIMAISQDASAGISNVKITAKSNTSVTIHADKLNTVLGILTLSNNSSVPVDIIAIPQ